MAREIGGFLELELRDGTELHASAHRLQLARHALAVLVRVRGIATVHVPSFICDSVVDALRAHGARVQFYAIADVLAPRLPARAARGEAVLVVNYFDLVDTESLAGMDGPATYVVDNAQALFRPAAAGRDTVYSPRKFFGVPDGGYLYTDAPVADAIAALPAAEAYPVSEHLLARIDSGARAAYPAYQRAQRRFQDAPPARMSALGRRLLASLDYDGARAARRRNFDRLHDRLGARNALAITSAHVPLCYPLLVANGAALRQRLIADGVFVPQYWPEVLTRAECDAYDRRLATDLVCLPTDHRYGEDTMAQVADAVLDGLGA